MESIRIIPDLAEHGFQDGDHNVTEYHGPLIVGGMSEGTEDGKPVVMLGLEIEEDGWLVKQTTLSLFLTAADSLKEKYGDPRT